MGIEAYTKNGQTFYRAFAKVRDRNGRPITKKQGNLVSEIQARKIETKFKVELMAMRDGVKRYRWNDWVNHCLRKMHLQFQPSTLVGYEANIGKWVAPVFRDIWLDKITPHDVHDLIFRVVEGVSPNTRRSILKQVKRIFGMALEEGVLTRNPCLGIRVKVPQPRRLVLNQTEISKLLNEGQKLGHPFYNHWVMALLTGMRNGELYSLKWSDVDFGNGYISVNKSWSKYNGVGPTKSTMNRIVPISKELDRFLKELKLKCDSEFVLERSRDWLQGNQASVLRGFCHQIGITPVKFHDLRATFITQLLLKGVPVAKVMAIVGHAELKTTMYYVRLVGADVMGVTDSLEIEVPQELRGHDNVVSLFKE